jgi:hypothetical protein
VVGEATWAVARVVQEAVARASETKARVKRFMQILSFNGQCVGAKF